MNIDHRKIRKTIKFTDEHGNPLSGQTICIRQKNHAFLFGCGGFEFNPYVAKGDKSLGKITDSWLEIFNYATLPFYWGNYEPEEGRTNKDVIMKTAGYLNDKGVRVKGHPLCWHTECAAWLTSRVFVPLAS